LFRNDFPTIHHYCVQFHDISLNNTAGEKRTDLLINFDVSIWTIPGHFTCMHTDVGLLMGRQYANTTASKMGWTWLNYTLNCTYPFNCIYILLTYLISTSNCYLFGLDHFTSFTKRKTRHLLASVLHQREYVQYVCITDQVSSDRYIRKQDRVVSIQDLPFYMSGKFKYLKRIITISNTLFIGQKDTLLLPTYLL
jgi:hypothetical protein